MAERACRQCGGIYILPEGNPDPKYCSDRCFSRGHADDPPPRPSRVFWSLKALLFLATIALLVFRYDAAAEVARRVPAARPTACQFLSWLGGEGVDRLVAMVLEPSGEMRPAALAALAGVHDPADARPRVVARLEQLRNLPSSLQATERANLMLAYGACGVVEEIEELIEALSDDATLPAAIRALGALQDHRATQPLLDLLGDAGGRLYERPESLGLLLATLSHQPDSQRTMISRFFPYLAHDSPVVRAAAARAIATQGADYLEFKERLPLTPVSDQTAAKARLGRLEKGLAAVQAAGPAEKEPPVREAMAESVARMLGTRPEWAR